MCIGILEQAVPRGLQLRRQGHGLRHVVELVHLQLDLPSRCPLRPARSRSRPNPNSQPCRRGKGRRKKKKKKKGVQGYRLQLNSLNPEPYSSEPHIRSVIVGSRGSEVLGFG